jgi:hypothetical protein
VFELSARAKDAFVLLLVGVGIMALALLVGLNLPMVMEAMLLIMAIILFLVAALAIMGVLAAIPYYFLKQGPDSEPARNYRLDDVKPVNEDERK